MVTFSSLVQVPTIVDQSNNSMPILVATPEKNSTDCQNISMMSNVADKNSPKKDTTSTNETFNVQSGLSLDNQIYQF